MIDPSEATETMVGASIPPGVPGADGSGAALPGADGSGAALPGADGSGAALPGAAGDSTLLGNRYLLEERIASGGMASVWRAHDEVLARTVAVKVLHDHLAADGSFRERFRREAIAAAKLSHPGVVNLYDTGTDGDRVYLVMEFVDGVTLRDVIAERTTLEPGEAAAIGEKVARALEYAHERGLVHRDIKPANILVGSDGAVKVADFGIAKVASEAGSDLTKTGMVLGTAAYVAPEQILAQPITGKADQYALACVLYEALTGQRAFKGDSAVATAAQRLERDPLPVRSLRADVPRGLDVVVLTAMAREPADRYATAGQLADALAVYADAEDTRALADAGVAGAPLAAVPATSDEPDVTGGRRQRDSFFRSEGRWLAPVLALLLLAVALVAVGIGTGVLEADGPIPNLFAQPDGSTASEESPVPEAGAEATVLPVAAVASFDPQGSPQTENDEQLPSIVDDDPSTSWQTDGYETSAFGGLKTGLGFVVDLGEAQPVSTVELTTPLPGFAYEIRVADAPARTIDGWEPVANVPRSGRTNETSFDEPVETRYLLIWITGALQADGSRFRAAVSGLTVTGG